MLHISALRGALVAHTFYKMFGTLEDGGWLTVALFRAGGYVGNTYMQMKQHRLTVIKRHSVRNARRFSRQWEYYHVENAVNENNVLINLLLPELSRACAVWLQRGAG